MKIPFSIENNNLESPLVKFLSGNKNFQFFVIEELLKITDEKIIFINKVATKNKINEILDLFKVHQVCFVIHPIHKKIFFEKKIETLFYPINPIKIQKKFLHKNIYSFSNIILQHNNLITNKVTGKNIYLTKTEASIIKALLIKKIVKRDILKKKILNINSDIETKSLESHLSRIRKKIKEIDVGIEILSTDAKEVIIKN